MSTQPRHRLNFVVYSSETISTYFCNVLCLFCSILCRFEDLMQVVSFIMKSSVAAFVLLGSTVQAGNGSTGFGGFHFSSTNGRVGYHLVARPFFPQNPCRPDEEIYLSGMSVSGTLPPGIAPPTYPTNMGFEGTPRQAGNWSVEVTVKDMSCGRSLGMPGPRNYGDFSTIVNFQIDP